MNITYKNKVIKKTTFKNNNMSHLKISIIIIVLLGCIIPIQAQTKKDSIKSSKKTKAIPTNFMDMQTNVLTDMLGENLDGKQTGKSIGYLELLDKAKLDPKLKKQYTEVYLLQSKDFNQKQKDSFAQVLKKQMENAKRN